MKKASKSKSEVIVNARRAEGLNQSDYWKRFGITQSGGSRYESGRAIPKPARLLGSLQKTENKAR